jgi:hypothetical protein
MTENSDKSAEMMKFNDEQRDADIAMPICSDASPSGQPLRPTLPRC